MKHIFIVNTAAGKEGSYKTILQELEGRNDFDYEVYKTKGPKDATSYIKELCRNNPDTEYRFYSCGGDGTLNEVVNGVVGFPNASMTCWPSGSGNDYVKCFGGAEKFLNLDSLLNGKEVLVDVMKVEDMYSINVINFGFDTACLKTMTSVKRKPIIGGKNAYYTGVVVAFITSVKNKCTIYADGEALNDGTYLMCTLANGKYVGGSFKCAPNSKYDDGLIDVCCFKVLPRLKMISLISDYQKGTHLENKKFKDIIQYRQVKRVTLDAPETIEISVDGEILASKHFEIENIEKAVKFVVPQ